MPTHLLDEPIRVDAPTSYAAAFEDFMALPEGTRAEYIDGTVYMSPAPKPRHQDVVQNLYRALFAYATQHGGYAAVAPFDVFIEEDRAVQPDVFYLDAERRDRISDRGIEGAPTLIAEVLSPSTAQHDLIRKLRVYEEADVSEYWVLDPEDQAIQVWTRTDEGLELVARLYETGAVASVALEGFEIETSEVFARP
ncbi:MAG: Uma2 family endonuclease [Rubricoccaceae bacterium]